MIVSKFGKSYGTANGSERHVKPPGDSAKRLPAAVAASQRWDNDGGTMKTPPLTAAAAPIAPPLTAKPEWSVRSLRALNQAIRQTRDDAPRLEDAERQRTGRRLAQLVRDRHSAHLRIAREWDRNPWENT